MTEDSVVLSWSPPADNGGCAVSRYVLETREASKRAWAALSKPQDTSYHATGIHPHTHILGGFIHEINEIITNSLSLTWSFVF
jgi:hypothetical protein